MGQDVSFDIAQEIANAKVFGSSDNIRHGRYRFLIRRIFAELVNTKDANNQKMAFWEFTVLKAEPNPQIEGDRGADGKLIDDGTKPNAVGSQCALKINFSGAGARSAGANIQQAILALFNLQSGAVPIEKINDTWIDLARVTPVKKGQQIGFNQTTMQPIIATEDKGANPACGMVIDAYTRAHKKRTPNEKGAYITKIIFTCAAAPGTGENAPELVLKRRTEIEASMLDDEEESMPASPAMPGVPPAPGMAASPVAPPPPAPMAPPPPAVEVAFVPPAPWTKHPDPKYWGNTPETRWYWSNTQIGGNNSVKSEADLKANRI